MTTSAELHGKCATAYNSSCFTNTYINNQIMLQEKKKTLESTVYRQTGCSLGNRMQTECKLTSWI